jgi:serine protease
MTADPNGSIDGSGTIDFADGEIFIAPRPGYGEAAVKEAVARELEIDPTSICTDPATNREDDALIKVGETPYYLVRSKKVRRACVETRNSEQGKADQELEHRWRQLRPGLDAKAGLTEAEKREKWKLYRGIRQYMAPEFRKRRAAKIRDMMAKLKNRKDLIAAIVPNYQRTAPPDPIEPLGESDASTRSTNPNQWALSTLQLEEVWNKYGTHGRPEVVVGVLDTGVRYTHPNLSHAMKTANGSEPGGTSGVPLDGWDFVDHDNDPLEPPTDLASFHGTHVAGIVAAATNQTSTTIDGVAGGVRIMPLRVLGDNGGSDYDIAQAILYSAQLPSVSGSQRPRPSRKADIINLSLGGANESPVLEDAIRRASEAGVVVVAAAGNEYTNQPSYPAAYPETIGIGALGVRNEKADYSNSGVNVWLMAPGGSGGRSPAPDWIFSTWFDVDSRQDTYAYMRGTSMASPHVAGIAALMKSVNPQLGAADIRRILVGNASREGLTGCDDVTLCGLGALDLPALMGEAKSAPPSETILTLARDTIVLSPSQTKGTITLAASGGAVSVLGNAEFPEFGIRKRGTEANRLRVTSESTAEGLKLSFAFNPTGFTGNMTSVAVDVVTDAGKIRKGNAKGSESQSGVVRLTVSYQRNPVVWVALVDASTSNGKAVYAAPTSETDGWSYHIPSPASGSYYLIAGVDADGDGVICTAGDPCGAYPSLSNRKKVEVKEGSTLQGLDFEVTSNGAGGNDVTISNVMGKWNR